MDTTTSLMENDPLIALQRYRRLPGALAVLTLGAMRAAENSGKERLFTQQGVRGAYAWDKALYYLRTFDEIDQARRRLHADADHAADEYLKARERRDDWSEREVVATYLWERLEVSWHLWIVLANQIGAFLQIVRKCTGQKVPKDSKRFWAELEDGRDEFEHLPDRIIGAEHPERLQDVIERDGFLNYSIGRELDHEGRLKLGNIRLDVSDRGFERIRKQTRTEFVDIREQCNITAGELLNRFPHAAEHVFRARADFSRFQRIQRQSDDPSSGPGDLSKS